MGCFFSAIYSFSNFYELRKETLEGNATLLFLLCVLASRFRDTKTLTCKWAFLL